jgi:hypothetical protein
LLFDESAKVRPLIQIWLNTFSRLKSLGKADDIYRWGQQIYPIATHKAGRISSMTEWDILLIDWAHNPSDIQLTPLDLPHKVIGKLQLVITQHEMYSQEIRFELKKTPEKLTDMWDKYLFTTLGIGSWINIIAQAKIQLSKWKAIISTLSAEELEVLDRWGYQNFTNHKAKNYFSLIQLASDIRTT